MELTREQAICWHRNMWNWIADFIEQYRSVVEIYTLKRKYCRDHNIKHLMNYCFLCDYTCSTTLNYNKPTCSKCPIDWNSITSNFMCETKLSAYDDNGMYRKCCDAETWQEQAALARQIANLPERKEVSSFNNA